ncbi:MAG: Lrp/AsnC family transcriptional regulator [Candidatus Marinamargulisbacteria bacterium]
MDSKDVNILNELITNGRETNIEISKRIQLAPSATLGRIKSLEDDGVITGYSARINHAKVGIKMVCFTNIRVASNTFIDSVADGLCAIDEVLEAYEVMGNYSYFVKFAAEDNQDAQRIIQKIGAIDQVVHVDSFLVLRELKYSGGRVSKTIIDKPDRKPRKNGV